MFVVGWRNGRNKVETWRILYAVTTIILGAVVVTIAYATETDE